MMLYEYWMAVADYQREHVLQRRGQAAFNVLTLHRPNLAQEIRSTYADPFYDDAKLASFAALVSERWNDVGTALQPSE